MIVINKDTNTEFVENDKEAIARYKKYPDKFEIKDDKTSDKGSNKNKDDKTSDKE